MSNDINGSTDGSGNEQECGSEETTHISPEHDERSISPSEQTIARQQEELNPESIQDLEPDSLDCAVHSIQRIEEHCEGDFFHPDLFCKFPPEAQVVLLEAYKTKVDAVYTKRAETIDKLADGEIETKKQEVLFSFIWQLVFIIGSLVLFYVTQNAWSLIGLSLPAGNLVGQFILQIRKPKSKSNDNQDEQKNSTEDSEK